MAGNGICRASETGAPAQLGIISDQLTQLRELLEAKISDDERDRQWVTQLTSELAQYRDDFVYQNVISKVLNDLIRLYDTIDQTLDPLVVERISKDDLVARLRNLRQQLLRAFNRRGRRAAEERSARALRRIRARSYRCASGEPERGPRDGSLVGQVRFPLWIAAATPGIGDRGPLRVEGRVIR